MAARDIVITPQSWTPRGEALVRGSRKDLVLWNAIPGEPAVAHLYHEGENQDLARVIRPAEAPHRYRREPPCDRFNPCGGCPLMHLTPEGQALARLTLVRDALAAFDLRELTPQALVSAQDGDAGFRHLLKLSIGYSDLGHLRVGVHGRDSQMIVPIPECVVATPVLREAMKVVSHHIRDLAVPPYDPEQDRGILRNVVLRQSRHSGELMVTLIAGRKLPLLWELAERIAGGLSAVVGVHLHLNHGPGADVFLRDGQGIGDSVLLRGKETMEERLGELRVAVGAGDLYPTNPGLYERLVMDLVSGLVRDRARPAVDLYCGVGGTTMALAAQHGWACGIETFEAPIDRARENAALNRSAAEFLVGDAASMLAEAGRRLQGTGPVVCVNPARRGLEAGVAEGVRALQPSRLAYQSCNPRALARDLADFLAHGWKVDRLVAYDLYPQTAHVELLAHLSPPQAPEASRRAPRRKVVREERRP